jgi:hypothetical protein
MVLIISKGKRLDAHINHALVLKTLAERTGVNLKLEENR